MGNNAKKVVVIPKEDAVFRLDENGVWYNADQKFENQKIIDYFHSMIKKDRDGFYLEQEHRHFIEKVYFPYEDTALFVCQVLKGSRPTLRLNTGETVFLDPEQLFLKNDRLYLRRGEDIVKFSEEAMFSLADMIEEAPDGGYVIHFGGKTVEIPRKG
jgi:hypothetical protein